MVIVCVTDTYPFFLRSSCAFHLQNKTSKTGNMFPKFEGAVTTILLREFPPMLLGKIIHQIMVFPLLFSAILPIFAPEINAVITL